MTDPVEPGMGADVEGPQGLDAPPYPAAFHYGPGHMIVHGNPPFVAMFGPGALGQPAREVMLDLPAKAFELMDLVLANGKPGACQIRTTAGPRRFVVAPRKDPETGETYGVTTHLRPSIEAGRKDATNRRSRAPLVTEGTLDAGEADR